MLKLNARGLRYKSRPLSEKIIAGRLYKEGCMRDFKGSIYSVVSAVDEGERYYLPDFSGPENRIERRY